MKIDNFYDKVYDVLVIAGGAAADMRDSFIHHHLDGCAEWRFGGKLGFGGKYRSRINEVDYYWEDDSPEFRELANKINQELKRIKDEHEQT